MSIFGKIMGAIFGTKAEAAPGATTAPAAPASGGGNPASTPAQAIDIAPVLDKAVADKKEKLQWRTSIVDLMKALDIDSSLSARKELAKETRLHRGYRRLRKHEPFAAQAGDDQIGGEWRQSSCRSEELNEESRPYRGQGGSPMPFQISLGGSRGR